MKSSHKKIRRIYYSAGMISLVLLPICLGIFLFEKGVFKKYRSFEINTMSKEMYLENEKTNDTLAFRVFHKLKFENYLLDSNIQINQSKIENALNRIKKIIVSRDYKNGIRFQFDNTCNYSDYVKVLNSIRKTDNLNFAILKDHVLAFFYDIKMHKAKYKATQHKYVPICGTGEIELMEACRKLEAIEKQKTEIELNKRFKEFYISYLLIVLMFVIQVVNFFFT